LPYATAGQEAALHPPITGPLEAGATEKPAQPTILVLPFRGEQKGEQAALGEALAEVLTIDLARQQGVSVVDRSHLTRVLQEQKLSLSGLVDQAAQLQVGKLLGVKLLLAGSFVLTQGKLTVTAHLFDVSTTQLVKSEEASGEVSDWLEVEKPLALALVKDLDLKLDEVQVRAIDEKPEVNLHFIRGLGYYYANRHDEAIMEFLNTLFGDEKYVDARYWMARSYLATGEPEHARLEFERILREYPEHRLASESRGLLGTLRR
jgi:TolB-like protein